MSGKEWRKPGGGRNVRTGLERPEHGVGDEKLCRMHIRLEMSGLCPCGV
ncbi:hypothetical protein [Ruminobacter sp.]